MEIVAKYPAARAAEVSRFHEVQDRVAVSFARRGGVAKDGLSSALLAGMTLQLLGVTFRIWFKESERDISAAAQQALATLRHLVCDQQAIKNGRKSASKRRRN